jgi:hypothetical protein
MTEGLPRLGKVRIGSKVGAILDESEFLGKPIEDPFVR